MADNVDIFENLPEDNKINNIINTFNFEIVRSYMTINNWKIYYNGYDELIIPEIWMLKNIARHVLEEARNIDNDYSYVQTAGFMALKWHDELSLHFIISHETEY